MKRVIAVVTCVALILSGVALPIESAQAHSRTPADPGAAGFTFPLSASAPGQGSFEGTLRVVRFAVHEGQVVALGTVSGTRVDEAGVTTAVYRTVSIPVNVTPGAASHAAAPGTITTQQILPCSILHLELGPLDLDLLGLVIHLDRVVLDISAVPGAGNLLGNLLCAITNLLNGVGNLAILVNLLNQLLDILT